MPESGQDASSSAVNRCSPQDDVSSSDSPQTGKHSADRQSRQNSVTCSTDSVFRQPDVVYDDVPAENLQHPAEGWSTNIFQFITHIIENIVFYTVDYTVFLD